MDLPDRRGDQTEKVSQMPQRRDPVSKPTRTLTPQEKATSEAAARWILESFERVEERFKTAHLRGFCQGLAAALECGLHLENRAEDS